MKAVIAHLAKVNQRIQSYSLDDLNNVSKLEAWICNDFMWTIMNNVKAKSFFEERFYYFDRLIKDPEYQNLEKSLFNIIQELGKFLNQNQIIEATYAKQKSFRNPFDGGELVVDLKVLAKKIFNRESYLVLGDHTSYTPSEEISIRVHSYPIRRQYEVVKVVLRYIATVYCEYANDEDITAVSKFLGKLNDLDKQLILLLKTRPERLHVKAFEWLHSEYAHVAPDSLTPGSYGWPLGNNKHPNVIKGLQEYVQVVFDDLELHFLMSDEPVRVDSSSEVLRNVQKIVTDDLIFTEDGKLMYQDCDPIFDLTGLQRSLLEVLFEREQGYIHKTDKVEDAVYGGESTKKRQSKFKKLAERLNEKICNHFKMKEAILYSSDAIRRVV